MRADLMLRAALVALDEAGDPTRTRAVVEAARKAAAPLRHIPRPANAVKRVGWCAAQLAMFANDPARAYARLRELVSTLYEPLATHSRPAAPAPEVAMSMKAGALIDALAPQPRVLARDIAVAAGLDSAALLADPIREKRVLGARSIASTKLGQLASSLAELIATDPDPIVRSEVLNICASAGDRARAKLAAELASYVEDRDAVRAAALDGLRAIKHPLADARLLACLNDPSPAVRAAAARSVAPNCSTEIGSAIVSRLADLDRDVRAAALDAVARVPALHRTALVAPLIALVRRHEGDDSRTALYLLGKLYADKPLDIIPETLADTLAGTRSDVARAAEIVLAQIGVTPKEVPVETRLLRAARELAAPDRDTQVAGLFEAVRLGEAARSLVPAIKRLGESLAVPAAGDAAARATLEQVREVLGQLGVPAAELPRVRVLAPWRGITPRERSVHGAYAIASVEQHRGDISALGVWDHATGAVLFVVEHAELLEMLPGRAEVGVIRTDDEGWFFERYLVPTGDRVGVLAIPDALTHGWPSTLAVAGGLVTVWCGDEDAPYRFHVKLGYPDRVIDEEPNVGARKQKRGSKALPRSKAKET